MAKKRILIIDDEASFTRIVQLNLRDHGSYEVRVINKGAKALEAAGEFLPQLILVDVIMPDMDGPTIVAQLKMDKRFKDTPVVFLTATLTHEQIDREKGSILGFPVAPKPISFDKLLQVIEKHIK